ncbi:hypothetical protein J7293_00433 [Nakaseomyces glabratus]|nr:hypothetical protein J7293_00433 [Nakaseomyces glabratus]
MTAGTSHFVAPDQQSWSRSGCASALTTCGGASAVVVTLSIEQCAVCNKLPLIIRGDEERDPVRLDIVRSSGGCDRHRWRAVRPGAASGDQPTKRVGGRPVADDQVLSHFVAQINSLGLGRRCRPERRVRSLRQVVVTRSIEQCAVCNNLPLIIRGDEERDPVRLDIVRSSGGCDRHRWRAGRPGAASGDQPTKLVGGRPVADDQVLSHFVVQINSLGLGRRCRPERRVRSLRQVVVTRSIEQCAVCNKLPLIIRGDEERDPVRLDIVRSSGGCDRHRWRAVRPGAASGDQPTKRVGGRPVADDQVLSHFVAQINSLGLGRRCRPERRVRSLRQVVVTRSIEQCAVCNNLPLIIRGDEERDPSVLDIVPQ